MALTARQIAQHFAACADRTARLLCTAAAQGSAGPHVPKFEPGPEQGGSGTASFGEPSYFKARLVLSAST